ncbi:hypothetical protein [Acinetobacter baumannii]|uniref:hypothetical protein n=1 Tax=Acinetobacter baumannii TaxID=470 RepID=UPI0021BEBCB9|nr:hypothetical protein [Acinetobacter baumannii]MCT9178088.1 hypothetical protein [Acinetobacter baumannii]MDA5807185.1 hypothetical protein [Acinetobacter baumannii]
MRFNEINNVKISDLDLDEDNYRFGKASNQQDCIRKIYNHSPENFKNIMHDIANHDLGEQLLVYKHANKLTVLDGNRRACILKILNNPNLAPNNSIKILATELRKTAKCDLNFVGAFVSDNLEIISKTVYERHAATGGIGRIKWSAYANARFRYDTQLHGDANWIAIALLVHFQDEFSAYDDFIADSAFSFETFVRIIRSAYSLGYIDHKIFNHTDSTLIVGTKEYKSALKFVEKLLSLLETREISLSRDGNYASAKNIENFLSKYFDIVTTEPAPKIRKTPSKRKTTPTDQESKDTSISDTDKKTESGSDSAQGELQLGQTKENSVQLDKTPFDKKIIKNDELTTAINKIKKAKFNLLYRSLLKIDPVTHPLLTIVGIWSLLDSLARLDPDYKNDFSGYFKGKLQNYQFQNQEDSKSDKEIIDWLAKQGNFTKHSNNYATINGLEIAGNFNRIQPIIGWVVLNHILKNNTKKVSKTDTF